MESVNKMSNPVVAPRLKQYQLSIFFALTLAFSAALVLIAVLIGDENITILSVFTPSLVAIALTALVSGKAGLRALLVQQTRQRVRLQWFVIALLIFPLIAVIAIGVHSLFGGPAPALRTTQLLPQMIVILLIALGEEYGWRGYALPKLQQTHNALVSSLFLGLVWGFWHFPGYLIGVGVPLEMPFYLFLLWVFAATILITWVYNHTQSVLMAILMHVVANATFNYLPLLPEFTGQLTTFCLFLGLVWLVALVVIALFGPNHLLRGPSPELE